MKEIIYQSEIITVGLQNLLKQTQIIRTGNSKLIYENESLSTFFQTISKTIESVSKANGKILAIVDSKLTEDILK